MPGRVVLAMSGGVDSSVAAYLLKERGYDVIGLFMRTGAHGDDPARRAKTCCSVTDSLDARSVADRLDIPFQALDFEKDFERIMDRFADEYIAGRTPNPCVLCNSRLKFGKLWAYGRKAGADFIATGHHARIVADTAGRSRVARAIDRGKDQSYVLFEIHKEILSKVLFPVGELTKAEVRDIAREIGLPVHDKPDSQEICFVPDDDHVAFVRSRRPDAVLAGSIVDESGRKLADHQGIEAFTIGQRKGLGIALGEPRYVVQIEPISRTVTIGPRESLDRPGLIATQFNWHVEPPELNEPIGCQAQIRSQHRAVASIATRIASDQGQERVEVRFEVAQPSVAPGQVVTIYQEDLVLGGGWIESAISRD